MRSRIAILSSILGWVVGCGGGGMRAAGDASTDAKIPDGRAPAREAGREVAADSGADGAGGRLGVDARPGSVDSAGAIDDVALPVPDSGLISPDAWLMIPDAATVPGPDSPLAIDGPMADVGLRMDVGTPPDAAVDRAVDTVLPPPDLGIAGPPDVADAASPTDLATTPLSLSCKVPDCWANLMRDCQPAGTCSVHSAAGSENYCFAEALKVLTTIDEAAGKMVTIVMKGSQICYQVDWDLAGGAISGASSTAVLKNGSGTPVATIGDDVSGYSAVTCTGGQPVVLSDGCDFVGPVICEAGACGL